MKLINESTGIVEFNGHVSQFRGEQAYYHASTENKFRIEMTPQELRDDMRANIAEKAGDMSSLLGTTSDATHHLLLEFSKLLIAINSSTTLDELKNAITTQAISAAGIIERNTAGEVVYPFQHKQKNVIDDVEQRATAVATQLTK
ncbi:hypothetical protein [Pseudoalteromonas luteoviolacea]|uniref:hypothetical protein n=1 Tax=Pseudoalteromonas luteoviolacea TaxID=43657 RepID=UPI001152699E|nr:hypothetical protein [Pseudoalteromonas luteoviolacea]TQF69543.1 hypothetical protein FLM44_00045 [Pseudoalteromonas luteoviolacea]